jgi:hypothetical protein
MSNVCFVFARGRRRREEKGKAGVCERWKPGFSNFSGFLFHFELMWHPTYVKQTPMGGFG